MENATVGSLFIEILKTGTLGFLFAAMTKAIGRREFAALIVVTTFIICAIMTYHMVCLIVDCIVRYLEPVMDFFRHMSGKKQTINGAIASTRILVKLIWEGGIGNG